MYTRYTNARDKAWQYLIRHRVSELPVDIFGLCRKDGISLVPYSSDLANKLTEIIGANELMTKTDGFAVKVRGTSVIFYDDATPIARQRFTVAHELGHIFCSGIGPSPTMRNKEPSENDDPEETVANMFAARILAPACVLWALGVRDAETTAELCKISITAAKWRYQRLTLLYEREERFLRTRGSSCFLMSPLERQVHLQFREYIQQRRL